MLVDTSGILAVVHRAEPQHADANLFYDLAPRRLTHSYVLDEWVSLANARGNPRVAALGFAEAALDDPLIEVVWVSEGLHRAGLTLLRDRPDKRYSLCDAVSFLLMRQFGITDALTTDKHFEQEGFVRLLK